MEKNESRRTFLKQGAVKAAEIIAVGGVLGALANCSEKKPHTKKVKLLSPEGHIVEIDEDIIDKSVPYLPVSSHNVRQGVPGKKWVMVFDLSKCEGSGKCLSGCSKMHYLPPQRSYIKLTKMQDSDLSSPYWMPSPCFHCDNPPCVKVCPVDATFKLSDGIVGIDNERCIGCRFCMAACPYSARSFNWGEDSYSLDEKYKEEINDWKKSNPHDVCTGHNTGTVEKCDFCPHNAEQGILPDCVSACPYGVIYFGDENEDVVTNGEETLRLKEMLKKKSGYRYLEELGTRPRVYYLPPINRQFPFEDHDLDRSQDYL